MELSVAAVGSDEAAADCDDSSRDWHFQLEVGVVWYCHETSEGWSFEDGMVLGFPVDYFEVQRFLAKVTRVAKNHLETYFSEGIGCFSWHDSMEGCA